MRDGVSVAKDLLLFFDIGEENRIMWVPYSCDAFVARVGKHERQSSRKQTGTSIQSTTFRNILQSCGVYISTVVPMGMNGGP
jgi:hypothetical protein